jgi:CheY-like chemotaxis protein
MKTIAVVEDNADNRLLLHAFLSDRYQIVEYENGRLALDGFRSQLPDLVLLDVSLPGMDGLEVLSHLRADVTFQKLPVIALTAHAMHGDRERFLKAGFNDYVAKPIVDETILLTAIERLIPQAHP